MPKTKVTKTKIKRAAKSAAKPPVSTKPRTQVFAHRGIVGIESDFQAQGLQNDPSKPGQMGFVIDAKFVDISQEALDLLKKVPKSGDDIGDVDVWGTSSKLIIFGFLGGPLAVVTKQSTGSNSYDASLLEGVANIVPNKPSDEFIKFSEKAKDSSRFT